MSSMDERVAKLEANYDNMSDKLSEIKEDVNDIHRLTSAVEKIADKTEAIDKKVDRIDNRVFAIEQKPANAYDKIKWIILSCVITALISGAISYFVF